MPKSRRPAFRRRTLAPDLASWSEMGVFLRRLAVLGLLIVGLLVVSALAYAMIQGPAARWPVIPSVQRAFAGDLG